MLIICTSTRVISQSHFIGSWDRNVFTTTIYMKFFLSFGKSGFEDCLMCSVVFLGKQDTLLLQYLSSVKCINAASGFTAGDKPAMDLHPIHEGVCILFVGSCYIETGLFKLLHDRPLGLNADFTIYFRFHHTLKNILKASKFPLSRFRIQAYENINQTKLHSGKVNTNIYTIFAVIYSLVNLLQQ